MWNGGGGGEVSEGASPTQQKNASNQLLMDFKSIVKSRHDFTVKSSALDLCLILLSNQLRIN